MRSRADKFILLLTTIFISGFTTLRVNAQMNIIGSEQLNLKCYGISTGTIKVTALNSGGNTYRFVLHKNGVLDKDTTIIGFTGEIATHTFKNLDGGVLYKFYVYDAHESSVFATEGERILLQPKKVSIVSIKNLDTSYSINSTPITLVGSPSGGIFSGLGVVGDTFSPSLAGIGTAKVTYSYTDYKGCTSTGTSNIIIKD